MSSIKEILRQYQDIALSDKEVLKLVDGKANLILYPDLHKYSSLDEILDPYGACILLFEAQPHYGHWCCIFKVNKRLVEFFNPYGGYPDDSLEYIPMHFRMMSNQYLPQLSYLMLDSPYELSYNEHKFQQHGSDIKTCGRWCAIRLIYRFLSLEEFEKMIKEMCRKLKVTGDKLVTLLTMHING